MGKYKEYLKNPETGIFTKNFNNITGNSWELTKNNIKHINGVLLSNAFEGKEKYSVEKLDLENAECIYIDNDNYDTNFESKAMFTAYKDLFGFSINNLYDFLDYCFENHKKEIINKIENKATKLNDGKLGISVQEVLSYILISTYFNSYVSNKKKLIK